MDIKADSEKTVKDILVSEGDEVQVGTPLFTYDTKDLAAKKESATLELESLNNTLSGYDAQIEQLTKEKKEAPKDQTIHCRFSRRRHSRSRLSTILPRRRQR